MICGTTVLAELRQLLIPTKPVEQLAEEIYEELVERLHKSTVSMLVCRRLPKRVGRCDKLAQVGLRTKTLAIDFGGTRLKFAIISMPDCHIEFQDAFNLEHKVVNLDFFYAIVRLICLRVNKYLVCRTGDINKFSASIAFSFPLNSKNEIVTMGKGFILSPDVKGVSVLRILEASFEKVLSTYKECNFEVEMRDIINDSVAVYLTSKFFSQELNLSLILGTGINSCFELPFSSIPQFKRSVEYTAGDHSDANLLINAEAGFLGSSIINITNFDLQNDSKCDMPLEYVSAGKWLPLTLKKILEHYNIPNSAGEALDGELLISIVEGVAVDDAFASTDNESVLIRDISRILLQRGAIYIVAAVLAIAQLTDKIHRGTIEVGYVGSFLANSTFYRQQIEFYGKGIIKLHYLEDSNLLGAAIATYVSAENGYVGHTALS